MMVKSNHHQAKGFAPIILLVLVIVAVGSVSAAYFTQRYAKKNTKEKLGSNISNLKVNSSGKGGLIIETDKGKLSGGTATKVPDDFPSDVSIYPNGKLVSVAENDYPSSATLSFEYEGDVAREIFSFYKENLAEDGWSFDPKGGLVQTPLMSNIIANKQNRNLLVNVAYRDGRTMLKIVYSR